jgi:hypothetical protein
MKIPSLSTYVGYIERLRTMRDLRTRNAYTLPQGGEAITNGFKISG